MSRIFELAQAFLALIRIVITHMPTDWSDDAQVQAWLHEFEDELAKVIVLLVPDMNERAGCMGIGFSARARRGALEFFAGRRAEDIDWAAAIDWIAGWLKTVFPDYAWYIDVAAQLAKQLILLWQARTGKVEEAVAWAG